MIKELNLSVDYLKAISGKFDVETIFNLMLPEKSKNKKNFLYKFILLDIAKSGNLGKCKNLVSLNIANNKLPNCSGLETLKDLVYLDLSYNLLFNMDGLEYLIKLKTLRIQGNKIDKSKNVLYYFTKNLKQFYLYIKFSIK